MITYTHKAGTVDVSVVIRIIDSTDGTPETGVTSATGGLDLQYRREGALSTAITEADLTNLNDAHSDGGLKHIGNGYYRLDLPDAACAAGARGVLVHGTATGMVVIGCYVQLVAYDPFDAVRAGLTALPNAAADAAGGLPISDAGGLDMDSIKSDTAAILVDTADMQPKLGTPAGASISADIAAIKAVVDSILADTGTDGVVLANGAISSLKFAANALDAAAVAADLIDEIHDEQIGDGTVTFREAVRVMVAAAAGKLSGAATTSIAIRNLADTLNRIAATVDADGNRSAVTLNLT